MSDPIVRPPAQRASDLERQAVVDHLRTATSEGRLTLDEFEDRVQLVLAARTCDDLAPVTADLPAIAASMGRAKGQAGSSGEPSAPLRRRVISVFSSARHAGPWEASPELTVVAVFGHSRVDLTACQLPPGIDSIDVRTIGVFAGVELIVPPGAVVDAGGFSLFGGRHLDHNPVAKTAPGLRVRVRSYGAFSGLLVRSTRRVP